MSNPQTMLDIEIWAHIASFDFYIIGPLLLTIKGLNEYLRDHNLFESLVAPFVTVMTSQYWEGPVLPNRILHGECKFGLDAEGGFVRPYHFGKPHGIEVSRRYIYPLRFGWEHGRLVWKELIHHSCTYVQLNGMLLVLDDQGWRQTDNAPDDVRRILSEFPDFDSELPPRY